MTHPGLVPGSVPVELALTKIDFFFPQSVEWSRRLVEWTPCKQLPVLYRALIGLFDVIPSPGDPLTDLSRDLSVGTWSCDFLEWF